MESAIGVLGLFGIFALLVIAGGFFYFILYKPGKQKLQNKEKKHKIRSCPICGGMMEDNSDSNYITYCTTTGCPNSRYHVNKSDSKISD